MCVCMTAAVLMDISEVGAVCICECVLEGLSAEINRLGPLSCFYEVLLI